MQSDSLMLMLTGQLCTRVEARESTQSQPNQLQRHHCLSFLAAGIVSGSTELLVSSLSLSFALGVTWPIDVTTPTHCADRRTLACVRAVRPNPPNPPSLRPTYCPAMYNFLFRAGQYFPILHCLVILPSQF